MKLRLCEWAGRITILAAILGSYCASSYATNNHIISVAPTSINFGNQTVNTSAQAAITVTNVGVHALQIQNVSLSGSSAFTLTGWTGASVLQPSQSLQIQVSFSPPDQANYSANLTVYSNISIDPVVPITGVGIASTVSISPTTAIVQAGNSQQFSASVLATTNTALNWLVNGIQGGNSVVGSISPQGLYTAPGQVSSNSSVIVTASDGIGQANASVTVVPPATSVSVSLSPTSASLQVGQSQQFSATVSGTTNTAVNWLVNGSLGGNSTVGTISSAGLYTAPSSVPANPVTVTAQSASNSTSSANAAVTITPTVHIVDLSWTASTSAVAGYNIYRGTVSGGPYTRINASLEPATLYTDSAVQAGQTYYYVTTAVDSSGVESGYSNVVQAVVPTP
jgi:HYDIN/CFA65/VesB family protein